MKAAAKTATAHTGLPGNPLAVAAARQFVRAALAEWTTLALPAADRITDRIADDAVLLVSELVTNAVVHAGTAVELRCVLDEGDEDADEELPGVRVEVSDFHPTRVLRGHHESDHPDAGEDSGREGQGLRLVAELAESWGTSYRRTKKTVWFRLSLTGMDDSWSGPPDATPGELALQRDLRAVEILAPAPQRAAGRRTDPHWINHGALSFLAEASDLLAGQFDEDMVASLAGQLLVPRLADWCAVWLDTDGGSPRLARVWHASEGLIEGLRQVLEKDPPRLPAAAGGGAVPFPWPRDPAAYGPGGVALACRLIAGGRSIGTLLLGRAGLLRMPDEVVGLIEDFARRVALALASARQYTRQATISRVLQRGLLPASLAEIPHMESAVVYEPAGDASAGGDFYDVFPAGDGRWSFVLGDVCGNGPEAAVVTGLVRPWLRLLAREGYGVSEVLDRVNRLLCEEAVEAAADAVAEAATVAGAADLGGGAGTAPPPGGGAPRFLSLLYGELAPDVHTPDGPAVRCTLASAGHPPALLRRTDGTVRPVGPEQQILLGVVDDAAYESETFVLAPGETLLCVTDGVTERRSGRRQFDDGDGLAACLAGCEHLGAGQVADHIRRTVHGFGEEPPDDDLAMLVLQAR